MIDDGRSPPSALKGRLADVYLPALISGAVDALTRRLGDRATIDDPLYGRASSLAAIDPLLARIAAHFAGGKATYEHISSTTGVDRDAAEGRLSIMIDGKSRALPIAVVAERRRLREIELRVYYSPDGEAMGREARKPRAALTPAGTELPLVDLVDSVLAALRKGAVEEALAGFEEGARAIDATGRTHAKADGGLGSFFSDLGELAVTIAGSADDGRTVCVEANVTRARREAAPTMFAFERGDSGLVRELRVYWD